MADFVSHDLLGEQALALFPAAAQRAAALRPAVNVKGRGSNYGFGRKSGQCPTVL